MSSISENPELSQAIEFSIAHETAWDRSPDGVWGVHQDDPAPWNRLFGPVHDRGGVSGTILKGGETVARWGEPERPDLTFSVAKAYLALLAGIAFDRGLIQDVHQPIGDSLPGIGFDDPHNAKVTWHHLLQQTSEWTGTCFDIPDQVEHYRALSFAPPPAGKKGDKRPLQEPGTYWEYNDVRINQLSLALLHLFRRPLPEVFRKEIAEPAGLSGDWRWVGYDHAWVEIDGVRMQSVPGGSHWGGGVSISSDDQAKIGLILLQQGLAGDRRIVSADWIERMRTPCTIAPFYGYLVWLNHDHLLFPSIPASGYFGFGAGGAFTWMEPEKDLVVVVRWLDAEHADEFFGRIHAALN